MKSILPLLLISTAPHIASAQLFSGEAGRGTVLGGLLGGIIGHNSDRRTAEGIGIGAGTGWLLGTLSREHRNRGSYDTYIPSRRRSVYADSAPVFRRPNYAVTGTALGAVAGTVIGHNQGRQTLEGTGIGAATGLVVGGIAEHLTRQKENRHYFAPEAHPILLPQSRFHRNPIPPPPTTVVRPKKPASRIIPPSVFKRVQSSQTSNAGRGSRPRYQPVSRPQTVIINNYFLATPPVGTNSPPQTKKGATH